MALIKHSTEYLEALDAFLDERRACAFEWGVQDCCTLAADWVRLVRGSDPMAGLRGLASEFQAMRAVADLGGLRSAVSSRMGEAIPGAMAQAGDLALVDDAGRESIGICTGGAVAVAAPQGLALAPLTSVRATWRV